MNQLSTYLFSLLAAASVSFSAHAVDIFDAPGPSDTFCSSVVDYRHMEITKEQEANGYAYKNACWMYLNEHAPPGVLRGGEHQWLSDDERLIIIELQRKFNDEVWKK